MFHVAGSDFQKYWCPRDWGQAEPGKPEACGSLDLPSFPSSFIEGFFSKGCREIRILLCNSIQSSHLWNSCLLSTQLREHLNLWAFMNSYSEEHRNYLTACSKNILCWRVSSWKLKTHFSKVPATALSRLSWRCEADFTNHDLFPFTWKFVECKIHRIPLLPEETKDIYIISTRAVTLLLLKCYMGRIPLTSQNILLYWHIVVHPLFSSFLMKI